MRMSFLAFPNTGATVSRAEAWAKIIAGIAANTEAPNWYTCVGIPERIIRSSLKQYLSIGIMVLPWTHWGNFCYLEMFDFWFYL